MQDEIRIGLIGCGGIAQGHIAQYTAAKGGHVEAVCDIDPAALAKSAEKCGVPEDRRFSDYRDLLASGLVDAVDICTPNNLHVPMALDALAAGLPYCVEKPLGISTPECVRLAEKTKAAGLPAMICFSYRFRPAVRYARELAEQGMLGRIVNIYAMYLKSSAYMPGRRLDWRFDRDIARYGVSGDLGVHILDLTSFLAGDITRVIGELGIAVGRRKRLDSEEYADVTTDDWCHFLADFQSGASATFSITRAAYGNRNHIKVDVYGEKAALRFDLNDDTKLEICRGEDINAFETIEIPAEYRAGQQQCFLDLLHGKPDKYIPTIEDGVKMQRVLDAIMASGDAERWVTVR